MPKSITFESRVQPRQRAQEENFPWTITPASCFLRAMSQPEQKMTTPASIAVDAVLVLAFFAFMFGVLKSHVPSNDPRMINFWSAAASSCLSGVWWLCIQMFRVVLRAQLAARK